MMMHDHKITGATTVVSEPLQVKIAVAAQLLSYDARTIRRLITRKELQAIGRGQTAACPHEQHS